jgi:hypothetical protein
MSYIEKWLVDSDPEAEWELWYQDTFDRECPRQVQAAGKGLAAGIMQLWTRHLFETVRGDGGKGFSRFNLWWMQQSRSIEIFCEWGGMVRTRKWVFGDQQQKDKEPVGEENQALLARIAATHGCLILAGQTSEAILAAATDSINREDFEGRLLKLEADAWEKND